MKKTIIFFFTLIVCAIIGYKYMYKEHRDISTEKAFASITALGFIDEVSKQAALPDEYVDKTIEVSGKVTNATENEITLNDKLFFQFKTNIITIKTGQTVTIKARCIGYDDLLEEVKFDQSILNK